MPEHDMEDIFREKLNDFTQPRGPMGANCQCTST